MSEPEATLLEPGHGAVRRTRCECLDRVLKQRFRPQHLKHLFGIILPVGRDMDVATGLQAVNKLGYERRLQEPAFVMSLLRPGIREEYVHTPQARWWDHVPHHLDRIMLDHTQIGDTEFCDLFQQATHTRSMYFHSEQVDLRVCSRKRRGSFAHAEADLQDFRCFTPKNRVQIDRFRAEGDAPVWKQRLDRALLCI